MGRPAAATVHQGSGPNGLVKYAMSNWDEVADFVIVGSGGGSMCAALACVDMGLKPLILEKEPLVGGSTAMSGGIIWVPGNSLMREAGVDDTPGQGLTYLESLVPEQPGSTLARKKAYVETGPAMIDWLRSKGIPMVYCDGWPDYYDEKPGGQPRGRSVAMKLFDVRKLGPWKDKLRRNFVRLPVQGVEGHKLPLAFRTIKGFLTAAKVYTRLAVSKVLGTEYAGQGAAIQGWMLLTALKAGIDIRTDCPTTDLVVEDGKVTGVVALRDGKQVRIGATKGVLVNAGGFARNAEMRKAYGPQPSFTEWTASNPGDTGEMLRTVVELGAATHGLDRAIWCVSSRQPNGNLGVHANELAKPHLIVVDKHGKRFTDESCSYMETGQNIYKAGAVPCWAIMDARHRARYPWALTPPRYTPSEWITSGYMKKAATIEDLAQQCGIDKAGLAETVARFNGFVAQGRDEDFHRGERVYDRYFGDPTHKPSPTLGTLENAPYFAVEMYPGDVGTYGGLVTDENGRVLKDDGSAIGGLYATGNTTASVTGAVYPGAGASIGASFIFGYRAARHAGGDNA
jgi:3-oxosteroid 1-dehydrogenase